MFGLRRFFKKTEPLGPLPQEKANDHSKTTVDFWVRDLEPQNRSVDFKIDNKYVRITGKGHESEEMVFNLASLVGEQDQFLSPTANHNNGEWLDVSFEQDYPRDGLMLSFERAALLIKNKLPAAESRGQIRYDQKTFEPLLSRIDQA